MTLNLCGYASLGTWGTRVWSISTVPLVFAAYQLPLYRAVGSSEPGRQGGGWSPPHIFGHHLTLLELGGADCAHHITTSSPGFSELTMALLYQSPQPFPIEFHQIPALFLLASLSHSSSISQPTKVDRVELKNDGVHHCVVGMCVPFQSVLAFFLFFPSLLFPIFTMETTYRLGFLFMPIWVFPILAIYHKKHLPPRHWAWEWPWFE